MFERPRECRTGPLAWIFRCRTAAALEKTFTSMHGWVPIFLLFDIEVAFLYPFAMAIRELRWFGFVQVVVFFVILLVGYIYVWRKGVLDWGKEHERV